MNIDIEKNGKALAAKIVLDIINTSLKDPDIKWKLIKIKGLSNEAPGGKERYLSKEVHKVKTDIITKGDFFGTSHWLIKGCPENEDLFDLALEFCISLSKKGFSKLAVEELQMFFKDYWLYYFLKIEKDRGSIETNNETSIDWKGLTAALVSDGYIKIETNTHEKLRSFIEKGRLPNPAEDGIEWIGSKTAAGTLWKYAGWKRFNWKSSFSEPWDIPIKNGDATGIDHELKKLLEDYGIENKG